MVARRPASALDRVVRLLAARPRTTAYLRDRLLSSGCAPEEVTAALARAAELGYVNDRAFAAAEAARLSERFAPAVVASRLAAAGVPPEVAAEAVAAVGADGAELARELLAKRFGAEALDGAARGRAARFLAGRGFSAEIIEQVVG